MPPIHFDAQKKVATSDPKDLAQFATNLFHPFHHTEFMADLPRFLRDFADVLEKTPKKK